MFIKPRFLLVAIIALAATVACSTIRRPTPTPAPLPTPDPLARHLSVFQLAWEAVRDQYVLADYGGVDWEAVGQKYRARVEAGLTADEFARAMREMLAELPEGAAAYETRAERLEADTTNAQVYYGVGAFIAFRAEPEPHMVILAVVEDSPAAQAGLDAHDSIYAIDGQPIGPDEADTVVQRIRGAENTSVVMTVQSPGGQQREITIQRQRITATDGLRGRYLPSLEVAYYRVPVLADSSVAELIAQDLGGLDESDALRGIILDLRVAHSSSDWPLTELMALFGNGKLGEFYNRSSSEPVEIEGFDVGGSQQAPLIILIVPDTQGSPEILAGALRDAQSAFLVGLPTSGNVERASPILLPDGSRLLLATHSFRTSKGIDLAREGLTPDLLLEDDWDAVTNEDDPVLEAALGLLLQTGGIP
jgi:carboxyl-terminal processing protease